MKVTEQQVNLLIKTYMKNSRERLKNTPGSSEVQAVEDEVHISNEGKRVFFERATKQIMERARKETTLNI